MNTPYTDEEAVSNCAICTLAKNKRDCRRCPFNAGLVVKLLKENDRLVLPGEKYEPAWMSELKARAQELVWKIGDAPIFGSAKWFEDVPEVKY